MALGSSAPEILLSVIETVKNLGGCPGELGPSTIVGSAAFNLLVISAVSVYSVNETNDNNEDRDKTMPKGVKKINDMGVFTVTALFSVFSYIWMFIVLQDQEVTVVEAWITFCLFFVLVIASWLADRYKSKQTKLLDESKDSEDLPTIEYTAVEIYKTLINDKLQSDKSKQDVEKSMKMKKFLLAT